MSDSVNTGNIPITRNVDGYTFVLQSIHIETVKHLEQEIKKRYALLKDWMAFEDKSIRENGEYVGEEINKLINKAKEIIGG